VTDIDTIAEQRLATRVATARKVVWPQWAHALSGFDLHVFRQSLRCLSNYGGCTMTLRLAAGSGRYLTKAEFSASAVADFEDWTLGRTDFFDHSESWHRASAARARWEGVPEPAMVVWMREMAHRYQAHVGRAGAETGVCQGPMFGGPLVETWTVFSTPEGWAWQPREVLVPADDVDAIGSTRWLKITGF